MKKKDIAIFTWHNGDCNCGQTLQAFALQKKIEQEGFSTIIINYIYFGKSIYHNAIVWPLYRVYDCLRNHRVIKQLKFNAFISKNILVSPKFYSFRNVEKYLINNTISKYLLGSDQIWNPQAGKIPKVMLLDFNNGKKYSYSPSMCESKDFYKYKNEIKKISNIISTYKYVGVREESAKKMLLKFAPQIDISVILDPVFLFSSDEWLDLCGLSSKDENYILVYMLGKLSDEFIDFVNDISFENKIIFIVTNTKECPSNWIKIKNVTPAKFIELVSSAAFIVGDSFHMVSFSIIFRKQFAVFKCYRDDFEPNMERVTDLLERFELLNRYNNYNCADTIINYDLLENRINCCINYSYNHLRKILYD